MATLGSSVVRVCEPSGPSGAQGDHAPGVDEPEPGCAVFDGKQQRSGCETDSDYAFIIAAPWATAPIGLPVVHCSNRVGNRFSVAVPTCGAASSVPIPEPSHKRWMDDSIHRGGMSPWVTR